MLSKGSIVRGRVPEAAMPVSGRRRHTVHQNIGWDRLRGLTLTRPPSRLRRFGETSRSVHRMRSRLFSSTLAVAVAVALGATLAAQAPQGDRRPGPAAAAVAAVGSAIVPMLLESDAYADGAIVPAKYSNAGGSTMPAFKITNAPMTDGLVRGHLPRHRAQSRRPTGRCAPRVVLECPRGCSRLARRARRTAARCRLER